MSPFQRSISAKFTIKKYVGQMAVRFVLQRVNYSSILKNME